ncbi:MAG: LysM peptidoglycan-binding domain-containing protein [Verrucomicrobiota bacterium]
MKISLLLWFLCVMLFSARAVTRSQLSSSLNAKAVLLTDVRTGSVLYSRRADVPYPPASTVKLMTALLVWERTRLMGEIRVVRSDTRVEPSHVPLRVGEVVSVYDMTRTLLVGSDNDSAMALGRHVSGSNEAFLTLMNRRALSLGCQNTVFKTPNGLPASGQVTTCSDMMKIFNAVMQVPELRKMCTTKGFTLRTAVGAQWVKNHNKLLGNYLGMGPAKTGWTYASRHTYAASVTRGGRELRLTLLNSSNKWTDAKLLFDYGFANIPSISNPAVAVQEAPRHASGTVHRVKRGETLSSISRRHGVSVQALSRLNNISNPNVIRAGMVLQIPH